LLRNAKSGSFGARRGGSTQVEVVLESLAARPAEKETLIMPSDQAANGIQVNDNKRTIPVW
jgi:hypothetical protein